MYNVIEINHYMTPERVISPHLIALEIAKNYNGSTLILCFDGEGFDLKHNGTESVVKDICDCLSIPYEKIIFRTNNLNDNLDYFKTIPYHYNLNYVLHYDKNIEVSFDKNYGLFLGRPSNERLYTFYKHLSWKNKELGIATFHFKPENENEYNSDFVNFLIDFSNEWKYLKDILPYSDFNNFLKYPIFEESHAAPEFWTQVYNKISIELVCETSVHNESFFVTEKTLRPILYKKFFVTVGSKNYEKQLKELGFDIFEDIIDKTYDSKNYYERIDHMYESLDHFLKNLEYSKDLIERLEKNQQLAIELCEKEKQKKLKFDKLLQNLRHEKYSMPHKSQSTNE